MEYIEYLFGDLEREITELQRRYEEVSKDLRAMNHAFYSGQRVKQKRRIALCEKAKHLHKRIFALRREQSKRLVQINETRAEIVMLNREIRSIENVIASFELRNEYSYPDRDCQIRERQKRLEVLQAQIAREKAREDELYCQPVRIVTIE